MEEEATIRLSHASNRTRKICKYEGIMSKQGPSHSNFRMRLSLENIGGFTFFFLPFVFLLLLLIRPAGFLDWPVEQTSLLSNNIPYSPKLLISSNRTAKYIGQLLTDL